MLLCVRLQILILLGIHQVAVKSMPPFPLPCKDTGTEPYCECDEVSEPNCNAQLPDVSLDQICDGTFNEMNSTLEAIVAYCQSECAINHFSCLVQSSNENCTEDAEEYQSWCSTDGNGQLCWSRFLEGVELKEIDCSTSDLCQYVGSNCANDANDCVNNLNKTSTFLGCCAASLFNVCPFIPRPSTSAETYGICGVLLEPACVVPAISPSPSVTASDTLDPTASTPTNLVTTTNLLSTPDPNTSTPTNLVTTTNPLATPDPNTSTPPIPSTTFDPTTTTTSFITPTNACEDHTASTLLIVSLMYIGLHLMLIE